MSPPVFFTGKLYPGALFSAWSKLPKWSSRL